MDYFNLIIIFQKDGKYMFEFDFKNLQKLFKSNLDGSGLYSIVKGRVFEINNEFYKVKDLVFDFFFDKKKAELNSRLNVNIQKADRKKVNIDEVIELPLEIIQ